MKSSKNKGSSSKIKKQFIGFDAFQNTQTTASTYASSNTTTNHAAKNKKNNGNNNNLVATPVYKGQNDQIAQAFQWLRSKSKDITTKARALQSLREVAFTSKIPKESLETLKHLSFILDRHVALAYACESDAVMRRELLLCLGQAKKLLPKAFRCLILEEKSRVGVLFSLKFDPAVTVRNEADALFVDYFAGDDEYDEMSGDSKANVLLKYALDILQQCTNVDKLCALLEVKKGSEDGSDYLEQERYERVMMNVFKLISFLFQKHGEFNLKLNCFESDYDEALLWKYLNSSRA